jgi:hypothetical protein
MGAFSSRLWDNSLRELRRPIYSLVDGTCAGVREFIFSIKLKQELVHASGGLRCPKYDSTLRNYQRAVARIGACTRVGGMLRTVNVNWNDDGWNANANALDDNQWNDGNQVFPRNYC